MKKFRYESMGTHWEISIWDSVDDEKLKELEENIFAMSDVFDKTFSRFIKTSLVWKIANEGKGTYEVPEDFTKMLDMYFKLYEATGGKLNPLIGFTISDMGYDADYSLVPQEIIRMTPDLLDTVKIVDATHISVMQSVLFDFGALGKGYFVDKIASFLKEQGIRKFMVDGSGDIYYQGDEPISVGLEHPDDKTKVIGTTEMQTGAMCASGTTRRAWDKYHHVIDPDSNDSTKGIAATWVIADSAALADSLASCLFFVVPEALAQCKFEYCIMNNENAVIASDGFRAKLF